MDFLNIGGGELLVIVLLALILFRPEDIYKAMRTLGAIPDPRAACGTSSVPTSSRRWTRARSRQQLRDQGAP